MACGQQSVNINAGKVPEVLTLWHTNSSTRLTLVRSLGSINDLPAMARYSVKLRDTFECSTCFTCGDS